MAVGGRLREVREARGLSQGAFAEIAGVRRNTQVNYESDIRSADSQYFEALHGAGFDIAYVLTGQRAADVLTVNESKLIGWYRALPEPLQSSLLQHFQTLCEAVHNPAERRQLHDATQPYRAEPTRSG